MKKVKVLGFVGLLFLISIIIVGLFKFIEPQPCFSQKFVENYVSKYSKDFTLLKKESNSVGLNGFKESDETDWYFHDNELDFDFHVKTLKSEYSPKGKHISCNYYDYYMKKLIAVRGEEIKQMVMDTFSEIYDIDKYDIYYYDDNGQIRISIDGIKNTNFSQTRYNELCEIISKKLCEIIDKYDFNFKNRSMKIGWDVDLDTDWSDTNKDFAIMINNIIFNVNDYYNEK